MIGRCYLCDARQVRIVGRIHPPDGWWDSDWNGKAIDLCEWCLGRLANPLSDPVSAKDREVHYKARAILSTRRRNAMIVALHQQGNLFPPEL